MLIKDVCRCINDTAPYSLACQWDNSGFLVGHEGDEVKSAMVALDFTEDVLCEAIDNGCNLIVTHHPFIFKGINRITDSTYEGRMILKLIENGISLLCAHTNLDMAPGGINDVLCERAGLSNVTQLGFAGEGEDGGVIGEFRMGETDTTLAEFIDRIKSALGCEAVRYCGDPERKIRKVAVCSGGGCGFLDTATEANADAFLTADAKYHDFQKAASSGLALIDAGHFETEDIICEKLLNLLKNAGCKAVKSGIHNGFYKFR